MKRRTLCALLILCGVWAAPAAAQNRFIVRSDLGQQGLTQFCLLQGCTVVGGLDGTLGQLFLLTTPGTIDPTGFLLVLGNTLGIAAAEQDQTVSLVGGQNWLTGVPWGLTDNSPVKYFGATVWNGYAYQPAAQKVRVSDAQSTFHVAGTGIVAIWRMVTFAQPEPVALVRSRKVCAPGAMAATTR